MGQRGNAKEIAVQKVPQAATPGRRKSTGVAGCGQRTVCPCPTSRCPPRAPAPDMPAIAAVPARAPFADTADAPGLPLPPVGITPGKPGRAGITGVGGIRPPHGTVRPRPGTPLRRATPPFRQRRAVRGTRPPLCGKPLRAHRFTCGAMSVVAGMPAVRGVRAVLRSFLHPSHLTKPTMKRKPGARHSSRIVSHSSRQHAPRKAVRGLHAHRTGSPKKPIRIMFCNEIIW